MQLLKSAVKSAWNGTGTSEPELPQSSQAMFDEKHLEEPTEDEEGEEATKATMEKKEDNSAETDPEMEETIKTFDCLEEEIQYLRRENRKLQSKLKKAGSTAKSGEKITAEELSYRVQERLPELIKKADFEAHPNVVFIPSEIDGEVGLIDKTSIDWWSVVDLENPCQNGVSSSCVDAAKTTDELVFPDVQGLDGPFISIKDSDVIDSIAYFVAQCVVSMPECRHLTHEQMVKKLDTTFAELREKQFFHRMYDWTMLLYSTYGWTQYAWSVYQNPTMAKMVASCLWKAACWLVIF